MTEIENRNEVKLLDVDDYNQSEYSKGEMDRYVEVTPDDFAKEIESMKDQFDVVISRHNIEHTNEPRRCVAAMAGALKKGGRLYMAFPSEHSTKLLSRGGTLNFYDDPTHVYVPEFDWILSERTYN